MSYFLFCFLILTNSWLLAEDSLRFRDADFAEIKKISKFKKNSFNQEQLNDLIKEIAVKKDFTVAKVNFEKGFLTLDLKEVASQQSLEIHGNQALTSSEVLSILEVNNQQMVDKELIERNLNKLKEKYESIGLKKVSIQLKEKVDGKNVIFSLDINEGTTATLKEVSVLSNNPYLNNYIRYKLRSFIDKKIDKSMIKSIEQIVTEVLIQNRYLDAKVTKISPVYNLDRTESRLVLTIETTATYEFLFYGNKYFSAGNLLTHLDLDKNFLNYIKNQKLLVKNIEDYYHAAGFANTVVTNKIHFFEKMNKYVLQFNIKEGTQIHIKDIEITGKISRSPSHYRSAFYNLLSDYKNAHFFIQENLVKASDRLILQLKDEGYLRAEKISLEFKFLGKDSVIVQLQINENILTQIRNITFTGLKNFTASQLYDVIELKPNTPLNLVKLFNSYSELKSFYQKNGYLEFENLATPEKLVKYMDNFEFADIAYEFREGPQIRIKDVQVRGNTFTKDKVAIRELDLTQGDVLTSDRVNDSVIFLERTQLFSRAQINTSDPNTDISDRTVFVDVQEKNPGLLASGLGLSNEWGLTVRSYLGISYQNLGGTGRGVSARADVKYSVDPKVSYPQNRIVLGYYEPYLFFNRLRARISVEREQQIFFRLVGGEADVQERNEINFLVEKQINRRLRLIWHFWDLSYLRFFQKDSGKDTSKVKIANIGPAIEWDRRDDIFVPRDGSFSVAQMEYSNPVLGSTQDANNYIDFVKLTAGHISYTPLSSTKRWVLVNEVRGGYVDNLSHRPESGIPGARLFFLGGRATLRGYDLRDNERVPSLLEVCGAACKGKSISDFKVQTASHYYITKNEIRFPMSGDNFGGLVFYDGGAVFINGVDIQDHYRDTAGFGLRYMTPIGAFTGEIGFKLDKKKESARYPNENAFTIHFSMGTF